MIENNIPASSAIAQMLDKQILTNASNNAIYTLHNGSVVATQFSSVSGSTNFKVAGDNVLLPDVGYENLVSNNYTKSIFNEGSIVSQGVTDDNLINYLNYNGLTWVPYVTESFTFGNKQGSVLYSPLAGSYGSTYSADSTSSGFDTFYSFVVPSMGTSFMSQTAQQYVEFNIGMLNAGLYDIYVEMPQLIESTLYASVVSNYLYYDVLSSCIRFYSSVRPEQQFQSYSSYWFKSFPIFDPGAYTYSGTYSLLTSQNFVQRDVNIFEYSFVESDWTRLAQRGVSATYSGGESYVNTILELSYVDVVVTSSSHYHNVYVIWGNSIYDDRVFFSDRSIITSTHSGYIVPSVLYSSDGQEFSYKYLTTGSLTQWVHLGLNYIPDSSGIAYFSPIYFPSLTEYRYNLLTYSTASYVNCGLSGVYDGATGKVFLTIPGACDGYSARLTFAPKKVFLQHIPTSISN